MDTKQVVEANRTAWNETAAIHSRASLESLLAAVKQPDFSTLDSVERRIFAELGLQGKAVAQVCCNNARELLSLKLAGAGRCSGFDISDGFVAQGMRLAASAGVEMELVCTSVYDIPHRFDHTYDIVYLTVGALGWLPNLDTCFAVMRRLLAPGGALFIYEMHPILDMLDPDAGLALRHSYFRREPYASEREPDYVDPSQRVNSRSYWFHHTLADIITACLRHGLRLEHFEEHSHDRSIIFAHLAREDVRLPMCYSLVARAV